MTMPKSLLICRVMRRGIDKSASDPPASTSTSDEERRRLDELDDTEVATVATAALAGLPELLALVLDGLHLV